MNRNLCRFNYLSIVLGGAATVITVAISQIIIVSAKSAPQINRIAQNTTVQINNNADSPGGSGVIVSKQGNTYGVLTANHVVCDVIPNRNPLICRDDIAYTIRTSNGKEYPVNIARLQNKKNDADLAIVFFNSDGNYPVAKIGNSNQVVAGSPIYVYGYPASQGRSGSKREAEFSPGFVTSRPNKRPQGYNLRYNAVTQIGMSGGAVFDSEGRVVGIHGQGDLEGELESGSGSKVMIKSGWNAAIPINIFMKQKSKVKLKDLELIVDNSLSDSKIPQINNPSNARGYNVRASVLYEQQNYTESIEASTQALQKNPNNDEAFFAYFNRGNIQYKQGYYREAVKDYSEAIQKNPDAGIAYHNRAIAHIRQGNYQKAIKDWNQVSKLGSGDAGTFYNRGVAYSRIGDQQAAIADYTKALQLNSNYALAYNSRGNIYADLGQHRLAIKDYTKAIEANPGFADAYNNRAVLLAASKDKAGAIKDLKKAAQLLLDQGKTAKYQQVMDNIERLERSGNGQPVPTNSNSGL